MRIMLNTNVLLSAILFPVERMNRMIRRIFYVVRRKFPTKVDAVIQEGLL